jgi:hypothetical protein
VVVIRGA